MRKAIEEDVAVKDHVVNLRQTDGPQRRIAQTQERMDLHQAEVEMNRDATGHLVDGDGDYLLFHVVRGILRISRQDVTNRCQVGQVGGCDVAHKRSFVEKMMALEAHELRGINFIQAQCVMHPEVPVCRNHFPKNAAASHEAHRILQAQMIKDIVYDQQRNFSERITHFKKLSAK